MADQNGRPESAMILGAGLGKRMRPLTEHMPKPMVPFMGQPLIDHIIKRLEAAGVRHVVVNVHYKAEVLEAHLRARTHPRISISDERDELLDTGGGVTRALPLLGNAPFFIHNSDSLSLEGSHANLDNLAIRWREDEMDTLLLLAPLEESLGYGGGGDFALDDEGRIMRTQDGAGVAYAFTGVSIASPRLFREAPAGPFSLNRLWDRAIEKGRAFGIRHEGQWLHIGTPASLHDAETAARG